MGQGARIRSILAIVVAFAGTAFWAAPANAQNTTPTNGLLGEYYNIVPPAPMPAPPPGSPAANPSALTAALTRVDTAVDFGFATPPGAGVNVDGFEVAWSGFLTSTVTGAHSFQVNMDDGVRLWVNGTLVIDSWSDKAPTDINGSTTVALTMGTRVPIRLEYYENAGQQECHLRWDTAGGTTFVPIPMTALTPPDPPGQPNITSLTQTVDPITGAITLNLSWSAVTGSSPQSVIRYYVFRGSLPGGPFNQVAANVNGTSFADTNGIAYGQQYCYIVQAADRGTVFGPASTSMCFTPQPPPPRLNDHDEGLWNDKCSCGSVATLPAGPVAWALLPILALFLRRRR